MKKRIALFVVFAMLMSLFAGCSSDGASGNDASTDLPQDEAAEDKIVIGYTVNDLNDTWVSSVIDYVEQWADEHPDVEVIIGDGKSDVSTQMAVVEGWIEMGIDSVCLKPVDYEASLSILDSVKAAGINYVAMQLVTFCIVFWENPAGSNSVGIINSISEAGWFKPLFGLTYGWNLVIILAITIAMYIYLRYSKQGYEIAVVGESENTARYAGINVKKVILRTMAISGALCGVAGFVLVSGASHTISTSTAGGRGFTAIIVAWLSKFNAFVMMLVSFLLVFMEKGAIQIASQFNLNESASDVLTGIILFFILGCEFFINYRVSRNHSKKGGSVQ